MENNVSSFDISDFLRKALGNNETIDRYTEILRSSELASYTSLSILEKVTLLTNLGIQLDHAQAISKTAKSWKVIQRRLFSTKEKRCFAGAVSPDLESLPFCNRENTLYQMLVGTFFNWIKCAPPHFIDSFGASRLLTTTRKISFQAALTSMGMGKSRILTDWAKEVLQNHKILQAFVSFQWLNQLEQSVEENQPTSYSKIENTATTSEEYVFKHIDLNEMRKFDRQDLAHIFIAELYDAALSERYIGVKIQEAGLMTEASLVDVQRILRMSALYSLITAAQGLKVKFDGSEWAVPTFKDTFTVFFSTFEEKPWINLATRDICRIYVDHLFVPELANSLKLYREKGSVPIVLGMVDDIHNFMRIKDKQKENYNALFSLIHLWAELIEPKLELAFLPIFAGNALFVEVEDLVSRTQCYMQFLPLNIFYKKKYFDFFVNNKFPCLSSIKIDIYKDVELTLWRNYRKWFGVPRIIDYVFTYAQEVFGPNLENVLMDKERRFSQLTNFDSLVTKQAEHYYKLLSVKVPPYLLVSVAAGIPTSRLHRIPGTELTFGNYELKGYLFPANDYSTKVLWATNLLSFPLLDSHEGLVNFVSSRNYGDLDIIKKKRAVVLDLEFSNPSDMLKMVLFDPYLTRESHWKRPQTQGDDLEYTVSITMWLRYLIASIDNQNNIVALKDIVYSLPSQLINATVKFDGIIHLKSKFPTGKYWDVKTIMNMPKNYIYINAARTNYADVFFWVILNGEYKLIGVQTKNKKVPISSNEIAKEWNKAVGRIKGACDHLLIVEIMNYDPHNDHGFGIQKPITNEEVANSTTLLDGRGVVPFFWWIATREYLTNSIISDSEVFVAEPDEEDEDQDSDMEIENR